MLVVNEFVTGALTVGAETSAFTAYAACAKIIESGPMVEWWLRRA